MQFMSIVEAIELIQMEYAEMPELRLTFSRRGFSGTSPKNCANER